MPDFIIEQWKYDVDVLSQGWVLFTILPAMLYVGMFMPVKWAVLTMPIWLPVTLIVGAFRNK